ncbi:MAG TPA: hypothetical protein VGG71_14330 [Chitinophagaceae bacterium]|jgi:hypothetical protein
MTKDSNHHKKKNLKKTLLKEIEIKITETIRDFDRKISAKKLDKQIHKAGKILVKSLTARQIKVVHKEKNRSRNKGKKITGQTALSQ